MALTQEPFGSVDKAFDTEALRFPIGAASPLWFTFFGVAATASTWWWMSRWTRNLALECAGGAVAAGGMPTVPVEAASFAPDPNEPVETGEAAVEAVAESAGLVIDPVLQAPVAVAPASVEAAEATVATLSEAALDTTDDLTRLVGIGPKLAASLAERGVTSFAQVAALSTEQLDEIDKALNLRGRAVRDAWVSQAKRLAH